MPWPKILQPSVRPAAASVFLRRQSSASPAHGERRGHVLARALPWLRLASKAAIALALARLFVGGLRSALLYPGLDHAESVRFSIDLNGMTLPLLLAFGVYTTVWALEAGIRAERELADFV